MSPFDKTLPLSVDRFADVEVLRYPVPGFEDLTLEEKKLVYYLYEAALSGRDILWDQNYEQNLAIRRLLEAVIRSYAGERESAEFQHFTEYVKRVWFANGIHHHYSMRKFEPGMSRESFRDFVRGSDPRLLPLAPGESPDALAARFEPILYERDLDAKRVEKSPDADQVATSANNYYAGVSQAEAEAFYAERIDETDPRPISWGLNSQLVRENGKVIERVWKVGGLYSAAIERVVHWLGKAVEVTENEQQRKALELLIAYYESGDLATFSEYNIAWVTDTQSRVDTVNGFIEVYGDALGYRASWEAVVSIRDLEATRRAATISENAQWFEDHLSFEERHKKKSVVGVSAKVITVVVTGGDCAPSSPIGINLPNSNWIRKEHGSKSVTISNLMAAFDEASRLSGLHKEFTTAAEFALFERYGDLAFALEVDLHEIIGHGSGQIDPGVRTPKETLKSYASTLEESRADLVALYFMLDPKLVELDLMPSLDVGRVAYDRFIRNGLLMQLYRLEPGEDLEEDHMRNRQLISAWAYEKGRPAGVIERTERDGKTCFEIRNYEALRELFGELLREVQRVKSEGDFEAGRELVETYGVQVDPELHREVLERLAPLDVKPYKGFLQPRLVPVLDGGEIIDVRVESPASFSEQMLEYSQRYSFLD